MGGGIGLFIAMGMSMAQKVMARKQQQKQQKKLAKSLQHLGAGHLINARDTKDPLNIIIGQMQVGGGQVDIHSDGGNLRYLHIIQTIGVGEIDSIVDVLLDKKSISTFGGYASYTFYNGSIDQGICSAYQAVKAGWNDYMRGYAYLYLKLDYGEGRTAGDKWEGEPTINPIAKGLKLYDPRDLTTAWSNNPALGWYHIATTPRYALGLPTSYFDTQSIKDAADWCESMGYTCNAVIKDQEAAGDICDKLLQSARMEIAYDGNTYALLPLDYDAPVMSLTEDDILEDSWQIHLPSVAQRPNTLIIDYIDAEKEYVVTPLPAISITNVADDGDLREEVIHLIGCTSMSQAKKIAAYEADRRRLDRTHTFRGGSRTTRLVPGDMIDIKHSVPGWTVTAQRCRVQEITVTGLHETTLTVREENAALYDDTINITTQNTYTSTLPDPLAKPPSVDNVSITEEQVTVKDNTFARVKISWTAAANYPFLANADIWISRDAGSTYNLAVPAAVISAIMEPLKDGDILHVKILARSIQGVSQELADVTAYQYTVTGRDTVPADITGFQVSAAGDNVHLRWEPFADVTDLLFYEVRYGASFGSSLFFTQIKAVNYDRPSVKPGTHTFCIKAKDTLGNYSANAAVNSVVVGNPVGYVSDTSFGPNNYGTGTHSNTEQYNDPTYGYVLRVTHVGGLSGNYTSPQYDLGSIKTDRLWSVFETVIQATGATWQGGVGNVNWNTALAAGETWIQQFANVQAGILKMDLLYSENGTDWYTLTGFELLSMEVTARYLKYKIYITDNDSSSYIYVKPTTLKAWARA